MKLAAALVARLEFLSRVTSRECKYLLDNDSRLFGDLFTIEMARKIDADPVLVERLDAFVSRFGMLQDTVGDKLLPALLLALAETPGPAIDNLWIELKSLALLSQPIPGWKCVSCATK